MNKIKISILAFSLLICSILAYAVINPLVVTALNESTYVAITLPSSNDTYTDVAIWTEGGESFHISDTIAGTINGIVPANTPIPIGDYEGGGVVLYAKSATGAGTPNMIMIYKRAR